MDLNSEKGASSWLSVLPISGRGFALHNGAFHDAMCLCYNWHPSHLPSRCVCCSSFKQIMHSAAKHLVCSNVLRDFTANLLTEVCPNVCTKSPLQALNGELLSHGTSNSEDSACLDVSAQGFLGVICDQRALFYVCIFPPS